MTSPTQDADRPDPEQGGSRAGPATKEDLLRTEMERLGQLTSGVVHDFNNLLTIILGCLEQACLKLPPDSPAMADLEQVKLAGRQGSLLISRLVHANRPSTPPVVNINTVLNEARSLLVRTAGPSVILTIDLAPDLWPVRADPAEIWQLAGNLTTNARDAMQHGGRLVLRTRNRVVTSTTLTERRTIAAGDYATFEVADTGCGMDAATRARIFEPFFTTKGATGTGLGLATVARIVEECGGGILVTSQPHAGTMVEVLLPRAG